MDNLMDTEEIRGLIIKKLDLHFGIQIDHATRKQIYLAAVLLVKDQLMERRQKCLSVLRDKETKTVYYLCMEFLLGRSLKNSLYNLGILCEFEEAIEGLGYHVSDIFDQEPDAGLGNGGLGRLAACFIESAARMRYPLFGYSIRYEYGIFKQKIVDGWQTELPDMWLQDGEVWLSPRVDDAVTVKLDGHIEEDWSSGKLKVNYKDYNCVYAIPYDVFIPGFQSETVNILRLWSATNLSFDIRLFNEGDYLHAMEQKSMAEVISKVLYPSDNHLEGKGLRLRQQYFLVSASMQDIIRRHKVQYGTIDNLSDKIIIHINETHPALIIPELLRILLDDYGYSWEAAWNVVAKTIAYTNHTIMSEALEVWPESIFRHRIPRIYQIVQEINERFCQYLFERCGGDWNKVAQMAIINSGQIHMANLCVCASYSINGVSKIHSGIIKNSLFKHYFDLFPDKFTNVTNGIAYRRWLCQANSKLCGFITELIGDEFISDPNHLLKLMAYENDSRVLSELAEVKKHNKDKLAAYIYQNTGILVNTTSIFDVQVKRLHEYKRQLLNALHIIHLYLQLKDNPNLEFTPRTFLFGAKAAPGYYMAKQIIRLICCLAEEINQDMSINDKLKIVFMEDYRVSLAELLMPAAEISEQISLAGTEASGTGNMKLMMNGAITLGTMDGANVEIYEAVGKENIFLFGLSKEEVTKLRKEGYSPSKYYSNGNIRRVIDKLISGVGGVSFEDIATGLIRGQNGTGDPYMVLADFNSYCRIQEEAARRYATQDEWNKMSLINIAKVGIFSAERAIKEYAENIWKLSC